MFRHESNSSQVDDCFGVFNLENLLTFETNLNSASKESVITIGSTGAGKTTLIEFLTGKSLKVVPLANRREQYAFESSSGNIGEGHVSKTLFPKSYIDQKNSIIYWDVPGYDDSHGPEYEILNEISINSIFKSSKQIKVIMAVEESHLLSNRGQTFIDFMRRISQMFQNINYIAYSIVFVLTKAHNILNIPNEIQNIANSLSVKDNLIKDFLIDLINNAKFEKFGAPQKDTGEYSNPKEVDTILKAIQNRKPLLNSDVNFSISSKAEVFLLKALSCLQNIVNEILKNLKQFLLNKIDSVDLNELTNLHDIFSKGDTINSDTEFIVFLNKLTTFQKDSEFSFKLSTLTKIHEDIMKSFICKFRPDPIIDKSTMNGFFELKSFIQSKIDLKEQAEKNKKIDHVLEIINKGLDLVLVVQKINKIKSNW